MLLILPLFVLLPCSIIATTMEDLPPDNFVSGINELRRKYAKDYKVPNMHELMWSEDLLNILKPLDWSATWPDARITWRYTALNSYENATSDIETDAIDFLNTTSEEISKSIEDGNSRTMNRMEFFNPLQRFIACTPKPDEGKVIVVCLVGTEGSYTFFDSSGESTSVPGSVCHERYEDNDGLCVSTNVNDESFYRSRILFIEEINNVRRSTAKEKNVANMHQLMWSEELFKILSGRKWDTITQDARTTYRYTSLTSYESVASTFNTEIEEFFKKTSEEITKAIEDAASSTLNIIELINPLQRFIGCATKADQQLVCLVGTEGKFTLFDSSGQSSNDPGSDCHDRYQNEDGLCVPTIPSDESYFGHQEDKFVKAINEIRRKYAKRFNVPNMHQLIWSNDLSKTFEPMTYAEDWPQLGHTWSFCVIFEDSIYMDALNNLEPIIDSTFFAKSTNKRKSFLFAKIDDRLVSTVAYLEFLFPLQKFITCHPKDTKFYNMVCVLGPRGRSKMFDIGIVSVTNNVLGSSCSVGYQNEDGLCTPEDPSKVSFFGNSEEFLTDVNGMRMKYAKKYSVPNMSQLTWDESLETTAQSLNWADSWPDARVKWRYVKTVYTGISEAIEQEVEDDLQVLKEEDFLKFISSGNSSGHVRLLELLNPLQTKIGCAQKEDKKEAYILCLLGDSGQFKMWELQKASAKIKCKNGFLNKDGKCSAILPKKKPTAAPQVASAGNQINKFFAVIFVVSWFFGF